MLASIRHGLRKTTISAGLRRGMATAVNDTPLPEFEPPSVYVTMSNLIPSTSATPKETEVIQLDRTVFGEVVRRDILHLCVVHHRDGLRQGSANTKNRAEVRGSGRKIRPQKGSGRARLGDGQSPMLRGGGVAFGPKPRDFSTKLPYKVRLLGLRVALSARLKSQGLGVVPSLDWPGEKTKPFAKRINELRWRRTLLVTGRAEIPEGLRRASRNLPGIKIVHASELDVYSVIRSPRVVLDVHAVDWLEQKLGKGDPLPLVSPEIVTRMMEDIKLRAEEEDAHENAVNAEESELSPNGGLLEPEVVHQTSALPQ